MQNAPTLPAVARLVAHHGGPVAFSKVLGGRPVYQEIQRWLRRGWASPKHVFDLEPHLPEGMSLRDLAADRQRVAGCAAAEAIAQEASHAA